MTSSGLPRPKHEALYYTIHNSCVDSDFMTANVYIVQTQLNVLCTLNTTTNNNKNNNLKYKDLTTAIQYMWNIATKVIPVITRATGTISKSFRKYPSNITGKHDMISRNYTKHSHWTLHTYCVKCRCTVQTFYRGK
jgi:hypothetical protein